MLHLRSFLRSLSHPFSLSDNVLWGSQLPCFTYCYSHFWWTPVMRNWSLPPTALLVILRSVPSPQSSFQMTDCNLMTCFKPDPSKSLLNSWSCLCKIIHVCCLSQFVFIILENSQPYLFYYCSCFALFSLLLLTLSCKNRFHSHFIFHFDLSHCVAFYIIYSDFMKSDTIEKESLSKHFLITLMKSIYNFNSEGESICFKIN